MAQTCTKCTRLNPLEALFCYFDGQPLPGHGGNGGPVHAGTRQFLHEFVFPSGQVCRSFDELALTCHDHWATARDVLHKGYLERFLGGLGRADLAQAAQEAARAPDADRGLDDFLGRLPCQVLDPPKLRVEPIEVNLGRLKVGEDRRLSLTLVNQGMRLLSGSVLVENAVWLTLGEPPGTQQKVLEFIGDMVLPVNIRGNRLAASHKPLEARLLFETNGGTVPLLIRADVPVQPFSEGVLAGAISPRQIAEKARAQAKEAAALFDSGAVARWYQANGWIYPVQGPGATGYSGVQQFFEALGLAKPPRVEISDQTVKLAGRPGATLEHTLTLRTPENRPVYATAVSDKPWLEVGRMKFKGRNHGSITLVVPAVPNRPGETLLAKVAVTANGQQRFVVPVHLAVSGAPELILDAVEVPLEPVLVPELVDEAVLVHDAVAPPGSRTPPPGRLPPAHSEVFPRRTPPRPKEPPGENVGDRTLPRWVHVLPVMLLALVMGAIGLRDFRLKELPEGGVPNLEEGLLDPVPRIAIGFHERPDRFISSRSLRFGLVMTQERHPRERRKQKQLTFDEAGRTNNTCVRVDGDERLLGQEPGRWLIDLQNLGTDATGRERLGGRSVWLYPKEQIQVTQTVEVLPGEQSRLLDTCLVRYQIENRDSKPHQVGLRFLLDTFIGANDGVPFMYPGAKELCSTQADFASVDAVPDFVQALEFEDLEKAGTVAYLRLKLGGKFEPPSRVTLGAWPDTRLPRPLGGVQPQGGATRWQVPVLPIRALRSAQRDAAPDSAVVIYWNERELAPGEVREMGFTYGLGNVAGGESAGQLGLTLSGAFEPRGQFTLTAYVRRPVPGQRLKLILPEGFRLTEGDLEQDVPPLPPDAVSANSPVTWRIQAPERRGQFTLKVESSTGVSQTQPVMIRARGIFD